MQQQKTGQSSKPLTSVCLVFVVEFTHLSTTRRSLAGRKLVDNGVVTLRTKWHLPVWLMIVNLRLGFSARVGIVAVLLRLLLLLLPR